jgi:D-alanine-D-alanine ligase
MGALTLGLVLPAGPSVGAGFQTRARSAEVPWMAAEQRSATDLREAARALGIHCEVIGVPAHSARADFELEPVADLLRRRCAEFERVLIVGHGHLGGSGRLHAAARACGLPVLGPSELAIALAYDKLGARRRLNHFNVPVPRTVALDADPSGAQLERLGWPCVLKPRRGAAGAGVRRLDSASEIRVALSHACRVDAELLLEREVIGRELSVVLLHGEVLGVAEIDRSWEHGELRTTSMVCPPNLSASERAGVVNLARRAAAALQLTDGPTVVDLMVSERENEVVLEVEPLPPLHRDGVVARVARAAGLSFPHLCAQIFAGPVVGARGRARDHGLAGFDGWTAAASPA